MVPVTMTDMTMAREPDKRAERNAERGDRERPSEDAEPSTETLGDLCIDAWEPSLLRRMLAARSTAGR